MDTSKIEKISPEYWRNSQLSVARHYGGIKLNGKMYYLDTETDYLVREDIYKAEKQAAKLNREQNKTDQKELFT